MTSPNWTSSIAPWTTDQVSGQVVFEALQQSAGRRAILRDREAFPVFVEMIRSIEPAVTASVAKVTRDVDEATVDRVTDAVRRIFGRVLKELADLDNPMRTPLGSQPGEGGLFAGEGIDGPLSDTPPPTNDSTTSAVPRGTEIPDIGAELDQPLVDDTGAPAVPAQPDPRRRPSDLPSLAPDPDPGPARSRFDIEHGVVLYNERHPDYLLAKDDEPLLLDYLATLVAKEYVVYNNPRALPDELGEEIVRMLIRCPPTPPQTALNNTDHLRPRSRWSRWRPRAVGVSMIRRSAAACEPAFADALRRSLAARSRTAPVRADRL